jgi:hypothetical protein
MPMRVPSRVAGGSSFVANFWGESNQGDHIDLWNRNFMKSGDLSYIGRSSEVWFWEIEANTLAQMKKEASLKRKSTKTAQRGDA